MGKLMPPAALPVPADVQDQPGAVPGGGEHGQPDELLQGLQGAAVGADEAVQALVVVLGDDGHVRAPVADLDVDVPVQVRDVEQLLDVVRGDVALLLEAAHRLRDGGIVLLRDAGALARGGLDDGVLGLGGRGHVLGGHAHFLLRFLRWGWTR